MGKKVEVSYNPQLGYLQTIFHHNFDFLTGIKSYTERTDGVGEEIHSAVCLQLQRFYSAMV